jgi:hypothetical protein
MNDVLQTRFTVHHDTYAEYRAQQNREVNHTRFNNVIRKQWHGQKIKIQSNGEVRLFIAADRSALILRASNSAAKLIRASDSSATIHFSLHHVCLKLEEKTIYRTPAERLFSSKDGEAWRRQFETENSR